MTTQSSKPPRVDLGNASGGEQPRPAMNSRGQRIALTQEALDAFWRFYEESQGLDAACRPIVAFHGTHTDVRVFDRLARQSERRGLKLDTVGLWFTSSPESASKYGSIVMPAYLAIRKPLVFTGDGKQGGVRRFREMVEAEDGVESFRQAAQAQGCDGVVIIGDNIDGMDGDVYIVFEPEQIKSAIGNPGSFNTATKHITDGHEAIHGLQVAGPRNPASVMDQAIEADTNDSPRPRVRP